MSFLENSSRACNGLPSKHKAFVIWLNNDVCVPYPRDGVVRWGKTKLLRVGLGKSKLNIRHALLQPLGGNTPFFEDATISSSVTVPAAHLSADFLCLCNPIWFCREIEKTCISRQKSRLKPIIRKSDNWTDGAGTPCEHIWRNAPSKYRNPSLNKCVIRFT